MDWIQIAIFTTSEGIEPVSGRLYQLGINGIEIEDEEDFKDFLEHNKSYWDYVDEDLVKSKQGETCIKAYVSDNASGHELLTEIKNTLSELKHCDEQGKFGRLEVSLGNISEEDWANNWKKYFHPMPVGKKILIKPEWEELAEETDRIVFNINPGMTFGTGSHFTTQLCIEALEDYIDKDTDMLDLGCGSGILSIISLLLGAKTATAVDIDPNAIHIAYENAKRNRVDISAYTVLAGNVVTDENLKKEIGKIKYDVVVANIVADVIIALVPSVPALLKEGGVFIASGIISDRIDDVEIALEENGFSVLNTLRRGDWACLICAAGNN
ncbi:MAG: 50S ribosomal protein L11 methyltransferase [Clostridia bacterium]|nr:50S ribosomal protein L11 methyltransferase [Clostridia bacterium]